ncbi:ABC transporter permease [Pseudooceanicola marinus]|uniref:ABC transporter permease n=1 Tax=Pseudooceanicola marinus TaxID=396013 RepID=UPI001C94A453|nr:ABC transporter permease subunit [Pseudooceanicola marinus]MBY5970937.1 ABC transporter permease subunit [Ferrimonas balearica]MCA1334632.1 ABC transporter permease subunit [Pseudooceanicola marinus]
MVSLSDTAPVASRRPRRPAFRRFTISNVLIAILLLVCVIWLVVPFGMAVLWSLLDPSVRWEYPDVLPPALSFARWIEVWNTTSLPMALRNSYILAPTVAVTTLILASPTAYAFARYDFPGKGAAQVLTLLPLVIPGFVLAIFFSALIFSLGIYSRFLSILLAHSVLFLPYAIRLMTVAFSNVRLDLVDAARDLGASPWARFRVAYWPALAPGILASLIIVFIQSIEEFAVAFVVGAPNFTTIPSILYSYLGYNFVRPNAAVVSLVLVIPNVLLMLGLERLLKSANPAQTGVKG